MAASPTSRTLERLRADGWHAEVVEKWNPYARIRQDLWGFTDVLAIREGEVLAIQCTSGSNVSSRVRKITDSPLLSIVRKAGVAIEIWGWRKTKAGWDVRKVVMS